MTLAGIVFTTPWQLRVNPHLDQARDEAIAWMADFGLLHGEQAVTDFVEWRLAEVAAYFYPNAAADQCAVAAQMMGWYFLPFDDQLDGELGYSPRRVADVCRQLIDIVHGGRAPRQAAPTVVAFADLWPRMVRTASPTLRARLAGNWSSYFSSQVTEALDRVNGYAYTDLTEYFWLRAASTCAFGQNDLAECWGGIEVPAELWHHPLLMRMRQLAADVVALCNDATSTSHEDVTGLHNALHIIERTRGCDRPEALRQAAALAQGKVDELAVLESEDLARMLHRLGPTDAEALLGYRDVLHDWICGDFEWERTSTRNQSHRTVPDWAASLLVPAGGSR
ncbi:terpene synthase family protein [Kitasatospora sp. LaBMicrA B282]|uniref:terpene synthase family protein n=1 Tax=Kitasatospora sp. LaBMicrA B282 TaxID=3420949 RepID=UPI003D0C9420